MKRTLNPQETNASLAYEYDRGSNYESVLHLTDALAALVPETEAGHPDLHFFQVTHLISEYAWAQVHYELRRVIEHMDADRPLQAQRLLGRVIGLSEITVQAVRLLGSHLPQHSLLMMRNALPENATGLDSPGYRNLRRVARPVWKSFEDAVARAGLTLPELIAAQNDEAGVDDKGGAQALALLRESLLRFDSNVLEWKQSHLVMVWSQLGGQPGLRNEEGRGELPQSLGGRSLSTMEARANFTLFPELWRAAEETYWTLGTRHEGADGSGGPRCPVQH
ncbi:hypothetical protein [Allokutzneria oryzae]|uniref:Tryptophan 2,3-dioxygenase n=1 Tax=Allokutzneria oryzae TaxID=1378989 RepID=A0ABV5ZN93_9PSEU